ncbi:MAG: arylsulfatase [Lacipirellulaceae bacterium]
MSRTKTATILIALTGLSLLLQGQREALAKPNVIVIVTDDQGYGDMGCHGNPWLNTPHLDQLARQSVRLENYHVDPYCTPTRAALLTGRYCTRVGAWSVTQGRQLLNPDEVTMAEVFAHSGYRTALFGKWHLGDTWPYAPRFRGFDEVVCHRAGGANEIGNPIGNDYFDDTYFRNGVAEEFDGYCTDVFFDETIKFIRNTQEGENTQPFFVYLPTNAMHSPHLVAKKYSAPHLKQGHPEKRANFYGMIDNFDENLGRLLSFLEESDLEKDTIVIFMGDNGTAVGGPQPNEKQSGFNAGMRGVKGSVYEGGHRVACFARWPGKLKEDFKVDTLTSHRDWLPTLVELCELELPSEISFDGKCLVPLFQGDDPKEHDEKWPDRTMFVQLQADEPELELKPTGKSRHPQYAVMTNQWRMVNGELYFMPRDPGQEKNVAAEYPDLVESLGRLYAAHVPEVFGHDLDYTRFQVGSDQENPLTMTVRDWHPTKGYVIWQPDQLSDDSLQINGFWAIDVVQAGRYSVELARHPGDDRQPMGAAKARLKIDENQWEKGTKPQDTTVSFEIELPEGPALLQTWLTDANEGQRGAYFVTIEKL